MKVNTTNQAGANGIGQSKRRYTNELPNTRSHQHYYVWLAYHPYIAYALKLLHWERAANRPSSQRSLHVLSCKVYVRRATGIGLLFCALLGVHLMIPRLSDKLELHQSQASLSNHRPSLYLIANAQLRRPIICEQDHVNFKPTFPTRTCFILSSENVSTIYEISGLA